MKIKTYPQYDLLCEEVTDLIKHYLATKRNSFICLASGHTPIGVFQKLVTASRKGEVDLSGCTFISLDEWIGIQPNDPGSCLSMLKRDFFESLNINDSQIVFFNVLAPDLQAECDRLNMLIEKNGGLDIMLVGVGTNGHIGMNEPGTSFHSYAHISNLAEETKSVGQKYFQKSTALSQGITLGLKHFSEAKLPIVMASGKNKAAIIAKGLSIAPTEEIPLSIIQLITQGWVMLDEDAASQI